MKRPKLTVSVTREPGTVSVVFTRDEPTFRLGPHRLSSRARRAIRALVVSKRAR